MFKGTRSQRRMISRSAFTLIEVMLVLIILVILGSLAVSTFTGTQDKANVRAAKAQVGLVVEPINRYRLDLNKYPMKLEELWEEPSDSVLAEKWGGPYLLDPLKPDPWGNPYQYTPEGKQNANRYDFWSNGPDGKSGTDDDIGNWESSS